MAAGLIQLTFIDGAGNPKQGTFWSSDGTTSGNMIPVSVALNSDGTLLDTALTVNIAQDVEKVYVPTLGLQTVKRASIQVASSGANAIVAAVASRRIRVLQYLINAAGAVNAKWQSAANDKTGLHYMGAAGDGAAPGYCPVGMFETNVNEALNLNLSAAVAVGGWVIYVEVP